MSKVLVTVKAAHENLVCVVTQKYNPEHDHGHYAWAVSDLDGNLISAGMTSGGPARGKVRVADAKCIIIDHMRWHDASSE